MPDDTKPGDVSSAKVKDTLSKSAPIAAGGLLGLLASQILQSHPKVVEQIFEWGPALVILLMGAYFAPDFMKAQLEIAGALGRLSTSIEHSVNHNNDVRMAVATMADKQDQMMDLLNDLAAHNGSKT